VYIRGLEAARERRVHTAIIALHLIVSLIMIGLVLLQSGKGASIGAAFGGASSQTLFGSAGPASALGKITAVCAAIFMLTSLYLTFISSHTTDESIMKSVPEVSAPVSADEPVSAQAPEVKPKAAAESKKIDTRTEGSKK